MAALSTAERAKLPKRFFLLPSKRMFPIKRFIGNRIVDQPLATIRAIPRLAGRSRSARNISDAEMTKVINDSKRILNSRSKSSTKLLSA